MGSKDPLAGEVYKLGNDAYYRVVEGYLIFFDLILDQRVVNGYGRRAPTLTRLR